MKRSDWTLPWEIVYALGELNTPVEDVHGEISKDRRLKRLWFRHYDSNHSQPVSFALHQNILRGLVAKTENDHFELTKEGYNLYVNLLKSSET